MWPQPCSTLWLTEATIADIGLWLFLSFDIIFLLTAISTYTYVFIMIRKNQRIQASVNPTGGSTSDAARYWRSKKQSRQLLSVFLLVITFSLFTVVPDLLWFYIQLTGQRIEIWQAAVFTTLYSISYICDFVIYTFSSKPIKRTLKSLRRRLTSSF